MKMMKTLVASLFGLALSLNVNAQNEESNSFVHGRSDSYEWLVIRFVPFCYCDFHSVSL